MLVALIPARSASKRIPNKNIKLLEDKPLIAYSIATALSLSLPCYVSSDSQLYLNLASSYGAVPILRPPELATDTSTDYDVIRHACDYFAGDVLYLRPTTPFRSTATVQQAIKLWQQSAGQITGLRSVEELPESLAKCFYVRSNMLVPILGSWERTDAPNQTQRACYRGNGYVDICAHFLAWAPRQKTPWGDKVGAFITKPTIELDTQDQWDYAEYCVARRKHVF